jgi:glutamyl/glutaminyl-tRNA synthetase
MRRIRFAPRPTGSLHVGFALMELWTVIHALPRDETLRRVDAAL